MKRLSRLSTQTVDECIHMLPTTTKARLDVEVDAHAFGFKQSRCRLLRQCASLICVSLESA